MHKAQSSLKHKAKELSVKQLLAQLSIIEMEHPPYYPNLSLND